MSTRAARQNLVPETLHQRRVDGLALYSPVVVLDRPQKLVFISGQLSRDLGGAIVGAGDMRAQLTQTLENLRQRSPQPGRNSPTSCAPTPTSPTSRNTSGMSMSAEILFACHAHQHHRRGRRLAQPELMVEIDAIAALG